MKAPAKTRPDSTLDARLTPAQADDLAAQLDRGLSIRDATRLVRERHGIHVSEMTVSRWAAKRRRLAADARFAAAQATLAADRQQAAALAGAPPAQEEPDAARDFARANLLLLSQALFAAARDGDLDLMTRAARLLASVEGTAIRARRAEIARFAAETGRKRFEYRAAQDALAHDQEAAAEGRDEAEEIVPHRTKVERAVRRLFGPRPSDAELCLSGAHQGEQRHAARILNYRSQAAKLREEADLWEAQAETLRQNPQAPAPTAPPEAPEPPAHTGPMAQMAGDAPPEPGAALYWDPRRRTWCAERPLDADDDLAGVIFPARYRDVLRRDG